MKTTKSERQVIGWATNSGTVPTKALFSEVKQDDLYPGCWLCLCNYLGDWQWVRYLKSDCTFLGESIVPRQWFYVGIAQRRANGSVIHYVHTDHDFPTLEAARREARKLRRTENCPVDEFVALVVTETVVEP